MKAIRVLVADDHWTISSGLAMVLARHHIEVVGETNNPKEVLDLYVHLTPDVLVLDIRFGNTGQTGLNVAIELLRRFPKARIVIYSQFDQDEIVRETYRVGCLAFVPKSASVEDCAKAIHEVSEGKRHFVPELAQRLAAINVMGDDSPRGRLDEREFEVFLLMAKGHTNAEMVEKTGLSIRTLTALRGQVTEKLGVSRQADLTILAVKHRLIEP
jgi:two-component system, NarL family, invasion response regulator UvrY